jgi:hypothetical protein
VGEGAALAGELAGNPAAGAADGDGADEFAGFGEGEATGAGEEGGFAGEAAGAALPGEPAGAGEPEGLAPGAGDVFSSSAGAALPILERSGPIRIFPINTGRSKM